MYADDTTVSQFFKSLADLQHYLNCDLSNLQDWLHGNKLSLNVLNPNLLLLVPAQISLGSRAWRSTIVWNR